MPRAPKQPESTPSSPSLFDAPRPGSNLPEFTVTELSRQIKRTVEDAFSLVRVKGEIGSCKLHSSGHLYMSLKDEGGVIDAVCWRGQVSKLGIRPEQGMEVVCTGRITTYAGSSKYQLVIESMALAGQGALLKMLEDRRKKLAAEGLFDAARKRRLPFLPDVIGVVTSPTGAVIRDILHRLDDRFPRRVLVWPVPVQGEGAAEKIAAAIRGFNALASDAGVPKPDVLIVARGGGSLEDLMPFNEECVVRAVADSSIPVISAVGHETDTTLIDYAADLRAPTPTGAAEKAVPVRADLIAQVADDGARLKAGLRRVLAERSDRLRLVHRAIGDPQRILEPLSQRLDERAERLTLGMRTMLTRGASRLAETGARLRHPKDTVRLAAERLRNVSQRLDSKGRETLLRAEKRLEKVGPMLEALSPRAVLGRGYGLVYDAKGKLVTSVAALRAGESVTLELQDGTSAAKIEK